MSAVWEKAATDDPSTLLVMLALADWSNDAGVCWPSMESIAEKCRISERQAQRIIKELETADLLEVTRRRGRKHTNQYRLKVPTCQVLFSVKPDNESPLRVKGDMEGAEKVTCDPGKGDIAVSPEPSRSEPSKPEPPKPKAQAPFVLPGWISRDSWEGFEEMRKKIRKPMTDRARGMIVSELGKLNNRGFAPAEVLDQSTRNCWQDVYELKTKQGSSNGHVSKAQQRERERDRKWNAIAGGSSSHALSESSGIGLRPGLERGENRAVVGTAEDETVFLPPGDN